MRNEQDTINAFIPLCLLGGLPSVIACALGEGTDLVHAFTDVTDSAGVYYSSTLAWDASVPDYANLFIQLTCGCGQSGGGDTPPPLYTAWDAPGWGAFRAAQTRVNLGSPLNFAHSVTSSRAQDFAGGTAYTAPNGTWAIYGGIRTEYDNLGGAGSALGPPTSDEQAAPGGGRENTFAGASCGGSGSVILYTGSTGAHEMQGCIYHAYLASYGGPAGFLGYPTSDEQAAPGGGGRMNTMYGSPCNTSHDTAIYWSSGTGAWPVKGCIASKYQSMGQTQSGLGYPISLEYSTSQGTRQDFTGGYMIWANGVATPFISGTSSCISYGAATITGPGACSGFYTTSTWFSGGGVGLDGREIWTYANGTVRDSTANYSFSGMDVTHVYQIQAYIPNNHSNATHAHYHYCAPGGGCADGYVNQQGYTNAWAVVGATCSTDGTATVTLSDDGGDAYPIQVGADAVRLVRLSLAC